MKIADDHSGTMSDPENLLLYHLAYVRVNNEYQPGYWRLSPPPSSTNLACLWFSSYHSKD